MLHPPPGFPSPGPHALMICVPLSSQSGCCFPGAPSLIGLTVFLPGKPSMRTFFVLVSSVPRTAPGTDRVETEQTAREGLLSEREKGTGPSATSQQELGQKGFGSQLEDIDCPTPEDPFSCTNTPE